MSNSSEIKRDLPQLTKDQAIVLSVITGHVLIQPFRLVVDDIERRLGRKVMPQEFHNDEFIAELQDLYRSDLLRIVVTAPVLLLPPNNNNA